MAQGLDRRIVIHLEAPGERVVGVYQPGQVIDVGVWATLKDTSLTDEPELYGLSDVQQSDRVWIVRHRQDILDAAGVKVTDSGLEFNVNSIIEITKDGRSRRRFLELHGVAVT